MRIIFLLYLLILIIGSAAAQTRYRGSIPEALLRPGRGEFPRYPVDTVIGSLGRGSAPEAAYSYANWVAGGLVSGRMNHPALESINPVIRESYLSALGNIEPRQYRIGGGREEPDGSASFLVRFIGREQGITAEMYVRHGIIVSEERIEPAAASAVTETEAEAGDAYEAPEVPQISEVSRARDFLRESWMLEDLILDEAMSHEQEEKSWAHRIDSVPYERFF